MQSSITVDDDSGAPTPAQARVGAGRGPVVIEARGVNKSFRVPEHRMDTLKERVTRPLSRGDYRELRALRGVSFDVHKGEFFGIVGQNGSGKSTLLKVLASIYRADGGTIRMAGRLAPFIELGVGFDPELTARENNEINGVLMGLSRREARRRLDAVLDFAELREFVELKLKNYSSGMMMRLAFAIMVQADADIMLVDEVLAVGDVAFAQKCMDVFREKRRAGKTILLVTHDMGTVQSLCYRAMLMDHGRPDYIGDPEETAMRYYRLNFARGVRTDVGNRQAEQAALPDINARIVHARLENEAGERIENVAQGEPLVLDALLEARRELVAPRFVIQVMNSDSVVVFEFTRTLETRLERLASGQRVRLSGRIENSLVPGRYSIDCWVRRDRDQGEMAVQGLRLLDFLVYGTGEARGVVSVHSEVEAIPESALEP
jgi:ABC-type polysaccharide/polyol phosphate transport system ATPase subunit